MQKTIEQHDTIGTQRCSMRLAYKGWTQISGNTTLSEKDKLRLELWSVAHRNTLLDLRILAETTKVPLIGERPHNSRLALARSWFSANPVVTEA